MNAPRTVSATLLGAALLLSACGPRHAQVAGGGAATAPAATPSPSPSPSATPAPSAAATSPTPAAATPAPTPLSTPRPPTAPPAPPAFTAYPLPNTSQPGYTMAPTGLVAGSDGNLWWVDANSDAVGRTTPRGVTTVFHIPGGAHPRPELVAASDGTLWGATMDNRLLHITMAGAVTEVDPGTSLQGNGPYHLALEPDGSLWFLGGYPLSLFHRDPAGTTTKVALNGVYPVSLTWGPDDALWFAETEAGSNTEGIGRLDPATDTVTHYAVPAAPDFVGPPVVGPDHDLWFGEGTRGKVARITTQGVVTEFGLPRYGGQQLTVGAAMVVGRDGALWAAASEAGAASPVLARITLSGATQVVPVTVGGSEAFVTAPAVGPDGHIWSLMGHGYQVSTGVSDLVRDNNG
jgi:streptogramin lyase